SESLYGPFEHDKAFEEYMDKEIHHPGSYEGPTTYTLPDGRWCMMLDFFGCEKEKMGYVPFVASKPGDANFERATEGFSFPYGFKHGKVIEITKEEYERLKTFYN
ncbi:MAG: 1,4-beta-xylanase, partial [Clostridia bacterium]|nr:1,4-beta-xylanase [Clostridia bacterium]